MASVSIVTTTDDRPLFGNQYLHLVNDKKIKSKQDTVIMSDIEKEAVLPDGDEDDRAREDVHADKDSEEKVVLCPLTFETITQGLSLIGRTGNGLSWAYIKLDLKNKNLTDIDGINNYVHLRYLDLSNNHLTDLLPLASLTQLLWLKVDGNSVSSLKGQPLGQLPYLQWLSLAKNQLKDVEGLGGPALESLNLIGNRIQRVTGLQYSTLTNLVSLELRGNRLETTDGIYLPNLRKLYMAQNVIKQLEGLDKLERLGFLHLRDNQLDSLEGLSPNMKALQYLNVRGNAIAIQSALDGLKHVAKTLRVLVISENPVVETEDYILSVLYLLPQLERLNKDPVSVFESLEQRTQSL